MIKINNNSVEYLGFCMDYDEPDFFEELVLWLDYTVTIEVKEMNESYTSKGIEYNIPHKVIFINDLPIVVDYESHSIEHVINKILEELNLKIEIKNFTLL